MKSTLILSLLYTCTALLSHAVEAPATISEQDLRALGPLPTDKSAESVKKGEYNPFLERHAAEFVKEDGESEDSKIITILNTMPVSGLAKGDDGRFKVFFAGRFLVEGDPVPQLIENQTSLQLVSKVTEKVLEFSWVEDKAGSVPRKLIRPVHVTTPVIEQRRPIPGVDGHSAGTMRILTTSKGEKLQEDPSVEPPDPKSFNGPNEGLAQKRMDQPFAPNRTNIRRGR